MSMLGGLSTETHTSQLLLSTKLFRRERPFHYRELFGESSSRPLLPSECVHSNGHVVEKAVPGPLHISPDCADCAEKSTVQLVSGSTCIAIVTKDGH
ncbi:hypothetical protein OUZ56_019354 [Daphnia magna]|uniref:Uncharacterized protein n=1 Tax=Daphnia magna TaxID=35525 RepID=A0ABQ9ZBB8_9CRUS|nr:hypothetical protein OUZ56_019354 [Daphnia magna]